MNCTARTAACTEGEYCYDPVTVFACRLTRACRVAAPRRRPVEPGDGLTEARILLNSKALPYLPPP